MLEWVPGVTLEFAWGLVLAQFVPVEQLLPDDPSVMITDDQPFNEYFLLRRTFGAK
jgi:hypothetical protein